MIQIYLLFRSEVAQVFFSFYFFSFPSPPHLIPPRCTKLADRILCAICCQINMAWQNASVDTPRKHSGPVMGTLFAACGI